jgi:hypothetical protein
VGGPSDAEMARRRCYAVSLQFTDNRKFRGTHVGTCGDIAGIDIANRITFQRHRLPGDKRRLGRD